MTKQTPPPRLRTAPGWLRPGRRIYAVGDVHGCGKALSALHRAVENDLAEHPIGLGRRMEDGPSAALLVHLGDLIDRGPDSADVVRVLAAGSPVPGLPVVNLMGNHEWMMLSALTQDDEDARRLWLDNGGYEALRSWGVPAGAGAAVWARSLPKAHLLFLRGLAPWHRMDGYLFVHAGVRPGVPLAQQRWSDLLWIREPFLSWDGPLLPAEPGVAVVHGHTISPEPVLRTNRLGVDTGACRGGLLTCAVLEGRQVRFLTA